MPEVREGAVSEEVLTVVDLRIIDNWNVEMLESKCHHSSVEAILKLNQPLSMVNSRLKGAIILYRSTQERMLFGSFYGQAVCMKVSSFSHGDCCMIYILRGRFWLTEQERTIGVLTM